MSIAEHGWEAQLLLADYSGANSQHEDHPSRSFNGSLVRLSTSLGPWPRILDRHGGRRVWLKALELLRLDASTTWARRLAGRLVRSGTVSPTIIWSVITGNLWSARVGRALADELGCPHVLEFQDPVPAPGVRMTPDEARELSAQVATANLLVTTTQALEEMLVAEFPAAGRKTKTIYLSYSVETSALMETRRAANAPLTLLHAGTLGGGTGRNVRTVIRAIHSLKSTRPAAATGIRLRLMGTGEGHGEASQLAHQLNVQGSLEILPAGTAQEASVQQALADVLVVVKFPDRRYDAQIPGKLFAYLAYRKPILGIMHETEASRLLRMSGLGVVVPHDDVEATALALGKLWENRNSLTGIIRPNLEFIERFSRRALGRRIASELDSLLP